MMNKVYRLVWNAALNAWVVACEFASARGKGKSSSRRSKGARLGLAATSLALAMGASQAAWATDVEGDADGGFTVSSIALGSSAQAAASASSALAYSTALGSYATASAEPSSATGSTRYSVDKVADASTTPWSTLLGATLKNSAGSTEAHYFSINDNNTQSANYTNDGAVGVNSVAAGVAAKTNGARATALGYNTSAGAIDSMALGSGSKTTAIRSMALGTNASALGVGSIAQGDGASATPNDSIAMGTNAQTLANDASIAIGKDSVSQSILGPGSVAVGNEAKALTSGSVAIGYQALADESNPPSAFTGNVAIGRMAHATNSLSDPSEASTAVGNESFADKGGTAFGERTNATGKLATALGNSATATADNTVAVGSKAKASAVDAVAIGNGASAQQARAVALGVGSTTGAAVATRSYEIGGKTYDFAGIAPNSTVSIGNVGNERTLTNVAAGRINQTSTDAINGSQLYAVTQSIDDVASTPLTFAGNTGSTAKQLGDTLTVKGSGTTTGTYSGANLKTEVDASGNLNLLMADNPAFASVIAGGTTKIDATGLTISNGPSVTTAGIDAGGKQIKNVAKGTAGSDAVNVDQLNDTINTSAKTHYFSVNDNGTQGDNYDNDGATGINALAAGVGARAEQDGAVALGAGSTTEAAVATDGATIAGNHYDFAGTAPTSTVSVGSAGNERTITNVAAGRLSATSTDAVNGSQLYATNSAIEQVDAGSVKYDINPDGSINYNSVTLGGDTYNSTSKTGGTRITNVARGVDDSDAVNLSQLNETNTQVTNLDGRVTNIYEKGTKYFHANSTGDDSVASGQDSVAIGMGTVSSHDGSVALGAGSLADGSTLGNQAYLAGGTAKGEVNIGDRRITGVAAGAEDTDAVNVAQLKLAAGEASAGSVKYDVNGDGSINYNSVTLGGDTYNSTTKTGGTRITNVARGVDDGDAVNLSQLNETNAQVTNLDGRVTNIYEGGTKYFHANSTGDDSVASGQDSVAIGMGAVSSHDGSVALGSGSVTDVAVATSGTTLRGVDYQFAGANPTSTISVGSKGNERTITNVAAGRLSADSTDAVNGSQLYATNQALENIDGSIANLDKGAVKYVINEDGSVDYNAVNLGGTTYNKDGRSGGTRITNLAAGIDGGDAVNVDQLNIAMSNAEAHYYSVNDGGQQGGNYANDGAQGKNSLAAGVNASATAEGGVAMGSDSVAAREAGAQGFVPAGASDEQAQAIAATTSTRGALSVGDADNGVYRQVTGVAAGTEDSDAVNVAQLKGVVNTTSGNIDNLANGKDGMFQVNNTSNLPKPKATGKDAVAGGAGAESSGDNAVAIGTRSKATASNSVALGNDSLADRANSVSVGSAGSERQITNLAAGTADTDAVNLAQLNKATGDINNSINNVYSDLKHDLKKQDDTLSAGIAGALAAASLPQPYTPGASMASIGGGNYRGQNALAIGVSRISDNGKWVTKLAGNTDSQGQFGVSVGVGYQW